MAYTLEIISPIPGKGLESAREYFSRPEIKDEANYIELGLVVRNEQGTAVNNVVVTAGSNQDETQNREMEGTGNVYNVFISNKKYKIPYYPLHYEFKSTGTHHITFTVGDQTVAVDIDVPKEDNR